jgi:hypothetical protein
MVYSVDFTNKIEASTDEFDDATDDAEPPKASSGEFALQ